MRAVPAEVAHRDVERETCPEARLLEDHRECPTPKRGIAGHGIALQRVGIVKERRHLGGGEVGDGEEVPHPRRDAGHRTARRRGRAAISAGSASATRGAPRLAGGRGGARGGAPPAVYSEPGPGAVISAASIATQVPAAAFTSASRRKMRSIRALPSARTFTSSSTTVPSASFAQRCVLYSVTGRTLPRIASRRAASSTARRNDPSCCASAARKRL